MARRLKEGIIQAYCKYMEDTEVPSIFSLWTGISVVASALGRDCFIDQGHFVVFPNIYIVLVAGSAKCRKSTSISVGSKFIKKVEPAVHILSQKMTTEALIGSLSGLSSKGDSQIVDAAEGIIIVDELSTLIDKNAFKSGMISLLTKLYDCEDFPYETRGRGVELVKNPCLSILGASTLHWVKEAIPVVAIGGGFTSRVIFVFRDKGEKLVPWPITTEENMRRSVDISNDLNDVAKMRGGFALTDNALHIYKTHYREFMTNSPLLRDENLSGYAGRRMPIVLKVAMVIAASMNSKRLIEEVDMRIAIEALRVIEKDMPRVMQAINTEFVGDVCEQTLKIIMSKPTIDRAEMVRSMRHKLTVRQLDVIIETLVAEGAVKIVREGTSIKYMYLGN